MANVELKTDFKDGEKLYGPELNNNFKAIKAALEAMNRIVWQDDQEIPDTVLAFRGTTEELMNREIIDGQLLYDTNTGETYIDYEGRRISTGSGNAIHIGENEPSNASTQLWIPTDEFNSVGTEVVNSLEGNETAKAPSVAAVKEGLATIVESGENENGSWVKWSDGTMECNKFISGATDVTTSWGNLWEGSIECGNYAQSFMEKPFVHATSASGNGCLIQGFGNDQNESSFGTLSVALPSSFPNRQYAINLTAKGKWKEEE